MDDFLMRALAAGLGVALVAGPLGCFVVWRRMAYFGDTLAHSALLGVALGVVLGLQPLFGIAVVCLMVAAMLAGLGSDRRMSTDTLLGIVSHGALSIGLVASAFLESMRLDLMAYLFGDILAVGPLDLAWIWGGGLLVLAVLVWLWRPLLLMVVDPDMAAVEGVPVARLRLALMLLLALVVAVAMKIVGILLITALLIIPAAAARRLSASPESMAVQAALLGALAVLGGIAASARWDTPTGPSMVVTAVLLFGISLAVRPLLALTQPEGRR